MLRKLLWFAFALFIGFVWIPMMIKSCDKDATAERMSELRAARDSEEDTVFKADEDSGDDEYIISDESDREDRLAGDDELNSKEAPGEDYDDIDSEDDEDDFVEKSPVAVNKTAKTTISRKVIEETTYSDESNVGYFVITGSFADEVNADRMVEQLKEMGYGDAEKIVFDFSQYYSVVSGKYDTESSARAKSLELKNRNINAYVHKMRSKLFGD